MELNNRAISEKLKQRLGDPDQNRGIAERVAQKNRIYYELLYQPETKKLLRMTIRIVPLHDLNTEEKNRLRV